MPLLALLSRSIAIWAKRARSTDRRAARSNSSCRWRPPTRRCRRGRPALPRAATAARQRLERGRDLARARIAQRDDAGRGIVGVDPANHFADDTADIVGKVDHDERVARAIGGDRSLRADQRAHRLQRAGRVDRAQADDLGDIGVAVRARRADPAGLRRGVVDRLHPERPARGRHRDQPLERSVDRKISKYSDLDSGRSVTTVTLPLTGCR